MKGIDDTQKRALKILYVWWAENFSKYMPRREFERRLSTCYEIDKIVEALRKKNLVEVTPEDEEWNALRITSEGVDFIRTSGAI